MLFGPLIIWCLNNRSSFPGSLLKYLDICSSGGKYRYTEVSISIDTLGTVIDKYRYFLIHENSGKIWGNFEKILEENGKILKYVISGTF